MEGLKIGSVNPGIDGENRINNVAFSLDGVAYDFVQPVDEESEPRTGAYVVPDNSDTGNREPTPIADLPGGVWTALNVAAPVDVLFVEKQDDWGEGPVFLRSTYYVQIQGTNEEIKAAWPDAVGIARAIIGTQGIYTGEPFDVTPL